MNKSQEFKDAYQAGANAVQKYRFIVLLVVVVAVLVTGRHHSVAEVIAIAVGCLVVVPLVGYCLRRL